jgi:predicted SAM-dependent methyltransferase
MTMPPKSAVGQSPVLINIGCGRTFHPAWRNFDLAPVDPGVEHIDIRASLPLANSSCDAVYHAHVLEHLDPAEGRRFIHETARILKPGGITRVVVPDLEQIARIYLQQLEVAAAGGDGTGHRWMTLELIDQTVRIASGGEMGQFLRAGRLAPDSFVFGRLGGESLSAHREGEQGAALPSLRPTVSHLGRQWMRRGLLLLTHALLGRRAREGVSEGLFRATGEVHRWMYDRVSLRDLLNECGFNDVRLCTERESAIPHFSSFGLDVTNGRNRKPDSMYMEGRR